MKKVNLKLKKKKKIEDANASKAEVGNGKVKIKVKKEKVKKPKPKTKKKLGRFWYFVLIFIVVCAILAFIGIAGFGAYIVISAPEFDLNKLYEKEATLIYDSKDNLIATLGTEKREKITYDDMAQVLVDAIIATEDSRYFQHNGFDLARFVKASIGQVLGNSDAGGASTITMQVSKNSFTSTEASGIEGIIRKFTDIYMSIFKIEKYYTKEQILEYYVNAPYLGSGTYGVERASQVYFGKSVSDLSLPEAAMIAGLFKGPSDYDPYNDPEAATKRRGEVLYLMKRHGYISEEEYEIANSINIEDLIINYENTSSGNPYQGFIDTVVQEVIDETGNNPYNTPMIIYSTMDPDKQDVINRFYNGEFMEFRDDYIQHAFAVIDNNNGAILAVGAGRNRPKEMGLNYATQINRHPGSTAKPIFEYGPGIEYKNWSTYTPFFDDPEAAYSSGARIRNVSGGFSGMKSLKYCLSNSLNTCALEAFQSLEQDEIRPFVLSLGITPEYGAVGDTYINEAHAVGAFNGVNPVQLGSAYSAFANGGYYTKGYSYTKIIYRDTDEEIEREVKRERVMSPQTSYLITNVLLAATPSTVKGAGTYVASKTGTSSYDDDKLKSMGLSSSLIQDSWIVSYSPDYTIVTWIGYDELTKEYNITMNAAGTMRNRIMGYVGNEIFKSGKFENPGGIVSSQVEVGTIPAMKPSEFTPGDLIETHLFKSGSEPTDTSTRFSRLTDPTNVRGTVTSTILNVSWTSPGTPSAIDNNYLANYFKSGYGKFADKYLAQRKVYNEQNIGEFGFDIYLSNDTNEIKVGSTTGTTYEIDLTGYSADYTKVIVRSAYTIFKSNASLGATYTFREIIEDEIDDSDISITLPNIIYYLEDNNVFKDPTPSDLIVKIKDKTITDFDATITTEKITLSNDTNTSVAANNMVNTEGNYDITYSVKITYNGKTYNTQKVHQTCIVKNKE